MIVDITNKISLEIDHIEGVEALGDSSCMIYTTSKRSFKIDSSRDEVVTFLNSKKLDYSQTVRL